MTPAAQCLPRGGWGQSVQLHPPSAPGSAAPLLPFQVPVLWALPRKHPLWASFHLGIICCQAVWLSATLPGTCGWDTQCPLLSILVHEMDRVVGLSLHGVARMKQVNSLKSLRTVPVDNRYSMNAIMNYYYECIFLQEKFSLRSEFTGIPW